MLYRQNLLIYFIGIFIFSIITFPTQTLAETRITNMYVPPPVWTKEGNPYIFEGTLYIPTNTKFLIKEGVVMIAASSSPDMPIFPGIYAEGELDMFGTPEEPIQSRGIEISLRGVVSRVFDHVIFDNSRIFMDLNSEGPFVNTSRGRNGTTTITNSVLRGAPQGLQVKSGVARVMNSEIINNGIGVWTNVSAFKTNIEVSDSVLENNSSYDISNSISIPIRATDNWWGNPSGPGLKIKGPVVVNPWKITDPRTKKIECCSNVLFLPGLQASRLYRDDTDLLGGGTTTHRAWEPYTNNDVRSLFLDLEGKSINPTVRAKDVISSAYGIKNIYKSFFDGLDILTQKKKINEWKAFPYDWRNSVDEIATTVLSEIERLASTSQTRKVTILAHSNGGLVAKMIGHKLEKLGKSELLDKVVLVASPQLGTPHAVGGLLHGDSQTIAGGIVLKAGVARNLGLNMLGGYGLLPTQEYFKNVLDPILKIGGIALNSFSELTDFLSGVSYRRTQPAETDTKTPAILSSRLLERVRNIHTVIDTFHFPTTTEVLSLVGWGIPTTRTIEYASTSPRMKKSSAGDGTVVEESATGGLYNQSTRLYFNQGLFNREQKKDTAHASIFEADPIKNILIEIVSTSTIAALLNSSWPYMTETKPDPDKYPWMKWITVSVHSPVDLDIYDSQGRHMGLVPLLDAPDSDIRWFENTIGGQYDLIGDEKYYTLPADEIYTVKLKGTGVGSFTYQVQKFVGGDMTEVTNIEYADLPVSPLLEASTTIGISNLSSPLNLDVDGNGSTDIITSPGSTTTLFLHLDAMKLVIYSLNLKKGTEQKFLTRIEKIRKNIEKGKEQKAVKKIRTLVQKMDDAHWKLKDLTPENKTLILSLFDALLTEFERDN